MTFAEFRAWFDGYSELVGDAPTPEQWARIKEKFSEVRTASTLPWPSVPAAPFPQPDRHGWVPYCGDPYTSTCLAVNPSALATGVRSQN